MDIDVIQIARLKADTLNKLSDWDRLSKVGDGSNDDHPRFTFSGKLIDYEQLAFARCEAMATKLAISRARETNRDSETVLKEVQFEVAIELAKILAQTIHPVFTGTNGVKIEDDDEEEVCGICHEEMVKGEEVRVMENCRHKFHEYCIFQWVNRKTNCPLCRRQMETTKDYGF